MAGYKIYNNNNNKIDSPSIHKYWEQNQGNNTSQN